MSDPWMKFYPRDWRGDQALRAVSIAARGLWMECLCIMHEAKPYGHLLLNGEPVGDDTLARMTGASVDEVSALMAELRQAGVLSMTGKGVIFSRRMTKDHALAGKGRKAAQKRWAQTTEKTEEKAEPNGLGNGLPTTQKPEARSQKDASHLGASALLYDRLIDAASSRGPCHPNLAMGIQPIVDLVRKNYDLEADILPVIRERANPSVRSWSYFVTIVVSRKTDNSKIPEKPAGKAADWPARVKAFVEQGVWPHSWGPKPGEAGCGAPPELVDQARAA